MFGVNKVRLFANTQRRAGLPALHRHRGAVAVVAVISALGLWTTFVGLQGQLTIAQAAPSDDGLSASVTPTSVRPNTGASDAQVFTVNVTDTDTSGTQFDSYTLYGLPTGWRVYDGSALASQTSQDPIIYTIPKEDVQAGRVTIVPPARYTGTLPGVTIARVKTSVNLVKDFDNGTFDYIGTAKPKLPASNTQYEYKDPTVSAVAPACNSAQYGPCDGFYSLWPTANLNGPDTHYNNYWADLRSIDNPMVTPTTDAICQNWTRSTGNTLQVTSAQSSASGKIAIFNGSTTMPVPNDFMVTTVNGLDPNQTYVFSYYVANLSDDPGGGTMPVSTAAYVKTSVSDVGILIGSTQPLPRQASCLNNQTQWSHGTSVVMTGGQGQLILSIRNFGNGGFGNDVGIDNLALYPMAVATFDLQVRAANPGLTVSKVSDPVSGTVLRAGQTVTYTVTGRNSGDVDLDPVVLTDDMSDVLDNATYVAGSAAATIDGTQVAAPVLTGTTLTWSGPVATGKSVILTYKVVVKPDVVGTDVLLNGVTGSGIDPGNPDVTVPSNCVTGTETGCFTRLPMGVPGLQVAKVSDPVSGTVVRADQTVTYTVTAKNTGNVTLNPAVVTDTMSDVLDNATFVDGSAAASVDGAQVGAPTLTGTTLTWSGQLAAGKTVTLTYKVRVHPDVAAADVLLNAVTARGTDPGNPGTAVPSNCTTGRETGCFSRLPVGVPGLQVAKVSDPVSGTVLRAGQTVTYTVTAQNTGNVALNPAVVTDDMSDVLDNAAYVDGSAAASVDGAQVGAPTLTGTTLTWSGQLAAGKTVTLTYQVQVNPDVVGTDVLLNAVTGRGTDPGNPDTAVPSNCVTGNETGCFTRLPIGVPGLQVAKVSSPASGSMVRAGQTVTYTVTAKNTGNVTLNPTMVTDDMSDVVDNATYVDGSAAASVDGTAVGAPVVSGSTLTWSGSLEAGQTVTLTYRVVVNQDVVATDVLLNAVTGRGTDPGNAGANVPSNCTTGTETGCFTRLLVGVPGLQVLKLSDPVSGTVLRAGQTVTYTVTAQNMGNVSLNPAVLTDDMSDVLDNSAFVDGSAAAYIDGQAVSAPVLSGTTLTWSGPLATTKVVTVTYQVVVNKNVAGTDILLNAVTGRGTDPGNPGVPVLSNCVTGTETGCFARLPVGVPGLRVSKVSDPPSGTVLRAGQKVTYTVTAKNTGNVTLNPAVVTDTMSDVLDNATFVDGSAAASIDGQAVGAPVLSGTTLTWSGALAMGKTVTLTYQGSVNKDVVATDVLLNAVTGRGTDPGNPGVGVPSNCTTGQETGCFSRLPVGIPGLQVSKVSDPVSGTVLRAGQTVTYTVTGTNTGTVNLDPALLTDDLSDVLDNASYVAGSAAASIDGVAAPDPVVSGTTLTWAGPLAPGQTVTVSYRVVVNQNIVATDILLNAVTGSATDPVQPGKTVPSNCMTGQETGCFTRLPVGVPGLRVQKVSDPVSGTVLRAGQTVTYTVTAKNIGNVSLNPVVVSDNMSDVLDNATYVDGSAAASVGGQSVSAPTVSGTSLKWSGAVGSGQTVTITYKVVVKSDIVGTDILLNAVTGRGTDPGNPSVSVPSNCTTGKESGCFTRLPVGVPGLQVLKVSDPVSGTVLRAGQTVTYTVTATNTGNVNLDPTVVTDDMSDVLDNATYVDGSAKASIDSTEVDDPVLLDHILTWMGPLASGKTVTITYQVVVNDDIVATDVLINSVTSSASDPGNAGKEVPSNCVTGKEKDCFTELPVGVPSMAVLKVSDPPSGSAVGAGQTVTYTVTAKNTGNVDLDPAVITDDLSGVLTHADFVEGSALAMIDDPAADAPATASSLPSLTGTSLIWSGSLDVDQTVVLTYKVVVHDKLDPADVLVNTVIGAATDPGDPDRTVWSNCVTGHEPECTTILTVIVIQTGGQVESTSYAAGILAVVMILAGAGALLLNRRRAQ
ncbi:MAG: isopeptide-forming domain-containing fimbrial protein [Propionibacteriaceae bacterium]|nr:isopeptide-forming domain-containing fimbrial protein [Propionibacteriaceae bacterium]